MSTDSDASLDFQLFLACRAGDGADSALIAAALSATLQDLDTVLSPVIGSKGVAALLRRSLQLTGAPLPDPDGLAECALEPLDHTCLLTFLGQRPPQEVLGLGEQLLQTLYRLLGTLIGPSLTARLLDAVFAAPLSAPPAQDSSP